MVGKIIASLQDRSAEVLRAAGDGHHLALGPGEALTTEWLAAGLELPNLVAMRQDRLDRTTRQLQKMGYDGLIVMDPLNIRYVTDTTNMQVWVMHNGARYAYVSADGHVIVWEFPDCEFMAGHNELVDEVRPALYFSYFLAGSRHEEQARRWGAEMVDLIKGHSGKNAKIAIDQCGLVGYRTLEDAGISLGSGQEVMELARSIKGPDEIKAMRCAAHAGMTTMNEMHEALQRKC